jgi:hypothetical protein
MESFQKRDRDRKKIQKRNEKLARRKERTEQKRNPQAPDNQSPTGENSALPPPSPLTQGVAP